MRKAFKIFFLVLRLLTFSSGGMLAQSTLMDKEITLVKTKGSVEQLLKEISEIGGFTFTYSNQITTNEIVKLQSNRQSVRSYLEQLFPNGDINYIFKDGRIILRHKRDKKS